MPVVILFGASGAGKTTIAHAIEKRFPDNVDVFFFDQIGVPAAEQMIAEFGSGEEWQRAKTIEWMKQLASANKTGRSALFEGQTRPSFLAEGAAAAGGLVYRPVLVDCDDATRTRRLSIDREQPQLANPDMLSWARYLRKQAEETGCDVLDTTSLSLGDAVSYIAARLFD